MKKLIYLLILVITLSASKCLVDLPPVVDLLATVNITTIEGFNSTIYMGGIFHKSSMVVGFDHQYDTCYLTVTNHSPDVPQTFYKNPIEPDFPSLSLSKGLYSFYAATNENPLLIDFTKSFIAYSQPDSVRAGQEYNLELQEEVKQAVVLVDVSTVEGTPQIEIGLTRVPMKREGDFWYAYTLNPGAVYGVVGGVTIVKGFPFKQGEHYVWIAVKGHITTKDGFTHITYL